MAKCSCICHYGSQNEGCYVGDWERYGVSVLTCCEQKGVQFKVNKAKFISTEDVLKDALAILRDECSKL